MSGRKVVAGDENVNQSSHALILRRYLGSDHFAQVSHALEVCVPWLAAPLWFVPTEANAEAVVREGISRGRVWTAAELGDLFGVPGIMPEQVQAVARAKLSFDGDLTAVRLRAPSRNESRG